MLLRPVSILLLAAATLPVAAQKTYTDHDYAQAERWNGYNLTSMVDHTVSEVHYLDDGRVFYRDQNASGATYKIADPKTATQTVAFDNAKLASALSAATKSKVNAARLGVTEYKPEEKGFAVTTSDGVFHCDAAGNKCSREPDPPPPAPLPEKPTTQPPATKPLAMPKRRHAGATNESPDKKLLAFIRDNNLWVRVVATGQEHALTTDGVEDFGYATDNAGWEHSDAAILRWSADSKKIATFQQDQRNTGMMYLVSTTNRHPELEAWRYPLVGDKIVTTIQPVIVDVESGKLVRLKMEPDQHRSMECDDVSCDGDGKWNDVEFSPDNTHLIFVSTSRDHKDEFVRIADTATGDVREVFHEHVPTYYGWQAKTDWKYLPASNEILWVSERSNWAQVYLYDATTGKLKNQVTNGDGPVWDLLHVDEAARVLTFSATGKDKGDDPYYRKLYSVNLDGTNQTLLTPEKLNHEITASPDGKTFVDVMSTITTPQTAVLRDASGKTLMTLATQDISRLQAAGWKTPTPIVVKARDGKTDLYGMLWKPTNFDASKKYPLVDYIYPGPQDGSCSVMGPHDFEVARGDSQALAELGFAVICLDGMGNPHRSKSFHDAHASKPEDMGDDTIPDQVSGIKDLAKQFPWIDLNRVGMWGHSGGGNATVSAMFHFPDFFKVGWAESGNHEQREYEDDWDERWAGLEVIDKDGKSNYDAQANANYAKDLQGRLMLVHGTMDDNVPPANTLLVVDALVKANKNFDLLMIPNAHHGYGEASLWVMRQRWDYFVRNLAGGVPPPHYQMKTYQEIIRLMYGPDAEVPVSGGE